MFLSNPLFRDSLFNQKITNNQTIQKLLQLTTHMKTNVFTPGHKYQKSSIKKTSDYTSENEVQQKNIKNLGEHYPVDDKQAYYINPKQQSLPSAQKAHQINKRQSLQNMDQKGNKKIIKNDPKKNKFQNQHQAMVQSSPQTEFKPNTLSRYGSEDELKAIHRDNYKQQYRMSDPHKNKELFAEKNTQTVSKNLFTNDNLKSAKQQHYERLFNDMPTSSDSAIFTYDVKTSDKNKNQRKSYMDDNKSQKKSKIFNSGIESALRVKQPQYYPKQEKSNVMQASKISTKLQGVRNIEQLRTPNNSNINNRFNKLSSNQTSPIAKTQNIKLKSNMAILKSTSNTQEMNTTGLKRSDIERNLERNRQDQAFFNRYNSNSPSLSTQQQFFNHHKSEKTLPSFLKNMASSNSNNNLRVHKMKGFQSKDKEYPQIREKEKFSKDNNANQYQYSNSNSNSNLLRKNQKRTNTMNLGNPPVLKLQGQSDIKLCLKDFHIIKKLGQGKFGTVYLAVHIKTQMIVALKYMQKQRIINQNYLTQFIRQLKIQTYLDHPNIIKNYGFFDDKENFYAVMEVGCDGQLFDLIQNGQTLSEEATSFITGNLLEAINYLHSFKIIHRDIKPENIVLVHGNVKLCDFGWAVNKKNELRSTFCGTPLYLSPQLLNGSKYDQKVDIWAIGIMTYQLMVGSSPFDISSQQDLLKILTQDIAFPTDRKLSKEFKEFIKHALNKNSRDRMKGSDLLKLKFITKYRDLQTCDALC